MGPPNRPLRRELEKLFNQECPLQPNWPTFLAEIYISSSRWKVLPAKCKVSSHEMNPIFWFRREKRDLKSQRGGEGGGGGVHGVQNCIPTFLPPLPPNGPPLVILDHWRFSLPLNGSPGCGGKMKKSAQCGFSSLQKCGQLSVVRRVVGDHCRPSNGHQQSNKLAEYKIQIYDHVEWLWLRIP